jgi:hypothetical protein
LPLKSLAGRVDWSKAPSGRLASAEVIIVVSTGKRDIRLPFSMTNLYYGRVHINIAWLAAAFDAANEKRSAVDF